MSIQEHLNKIRNAIYGREVRESIAKGIETAYDDASENGNANMEVKMARGAHPNLNSRLEEVDQKQDETTSQLAQKASTSYVEQLTQQLASGSPSGVYSTLTELVNTHPNGASGIYITTDTGDWHYWDGGTWEVGGSYQTAQLGLATKIGVLAGAPAQFKVDTENKTITTQQYGSVVVGDKRYNLSANTYSFADLTSGMTFVAFDPSTRNINFYGGTDMTNSDDVMLGWITLAGDIGIFGNFQINGSTRDVFTNSMKNKLDNTLSAKETISTAILAGSPSSFNVDLINEKIITQVAGSSVIVSGNRRYLTNDEIDFSNLDQQSVTILYNSSDGTVVVSNTSDYARSDHMNEHVLGVIRRDTQSVFVNGVYSVNGSTVTHFTKEIEERIKGINSQPPRFYITDFIEEYKPNSTYITVNENTTYQEVYDIYDSLVTNFPDYVERSLLGNDGEGNPIYRYDFTPARPRIDNRIDYEIPKIYYQSGIHGHEKNAAMSGAIFFKELCEQWKENTTLRTLRHNFAFVVVPVLNPSGFILNQRKNANGVDLNRNFPTYWSLVEDETSLNYGGQEPLSEPETQLVNNIMASEENIILAIDHHNSGSFSGGEGTYGYWVGTRNEKMQQYAINSTYQMTAHIQEVYGIGEDNNYSYGMVSIPSAASTTSHWDSYGIPAMLFETTQEFVNDVEQTQTVTAYFLGNTLASALKNYEAFR